jgi:hypothetical protein
MPFMSATKDSTIKPLSRVRSRKVDWWDTKTPLTGHSATTTMLVNYAITREKTVHVGLVQGFLIDAEEGSRKELIDDILDITGGTMVCASEVLRGSGAWEALFVWRDGSVTFRHCPTGMVSVEISTTSKRTYNRLFRACSNIVKAHLRSTVYSLAKDSNGDMYLAELGDAGTPFEPKNYEPQTRMAYLFIKKELSDPNPSGRLTLIHGDPGSGKTYLIRGLLCEVNNARFVLIPSALAEDLGGPALIPALVKARADMDPSEALVLIIEDADRCLGSRGTAMDAISSILNASDGIMGASLNLRIICTTNAKYESVDLALLREGRLSLEVNVGELTQERALRVYRRLVNDPQREIELPPCVTLAQVYSHARKNDDIDEDLAEDDALAEDD